MSRPIGSVKTPSYRHHRASGQAVCTIDGKDHYLGPWKSKPSRAEYDRLLGVWLSGGRSMPRAGKDLAIVELIDQYWKYVLSYHGKVSAGGSSGRTDCVRAAIKIVKDLYGSAPVTDFGPLALGQVRHAMIRRGWCRTYINGQIGEVKRLFKWGVAHELVRPEQLTALATLEGLRFGKTDARESKPGSPVAAAHVATVLPFLSPPAIPTEATNGKMTNR